ncbi:hypothetical protein GJAV_G00272730 [Gymnothorax javanicus]|nr:hypothetical protein GJAV_G00272730 [Gymnothorax javanicus]
MWTGFGGGSHDDRAEAEAKKKSEISFLEWRAAPNHNLTVIEPNCRGLGVPWLSQFTPQPWKPESLGRKQGLSWQSQFSLLPWKPEYKGRVNLHVFEDWCGRSVQQLRKNLHFPLYPHLRTTVKKLAIAPKWKSYGLRIFGYLHPHTDGEYVFAVASDDNSEFWLSLDENPVNLQQLAMVGPTGAEWTAPGEFGKYAGQTSQPVRLKTVQRYYFEILHKQDDKGTDHVEVAWRLCDGPKFTIIDSRYISLYTDESRLKIGHVAHIPLSAASHVETPQVCNGTTISPEPIPGIDMLREDPRDSLFRLPLVAGLQLQHFLPACVYKPSYVIKGFHLGRYQGLQFIHLSYVYPNDYTRLTYMDSENKCFYPGGADQLKSYLRMDAPDNEAESNALKQKRKLLSVSLPTSPASARKRRGLLWSWPPMGLSDMDQRAEPVPEVESDEESNGEEKDDLAALLPKKVNRALLGVDSPGQSQRLQGSSAPEAQANREGKSGARISPPNVTQIAPPARKEVPQKSPITSAKKEERAGQKAQGSNQAEAEPENRSGLEGDVEEEDLDEEWDAAHPPVFDEAVNWKQTFDAESLDFQAQRSDKIDLHCTMAGNLLMERGEALAVVVEFLKKLNLKNPGRFSLSRVVNVEKRVDPSRGNRYLLELELQERDVGLVRLSHYIYSPKQDQGAESELKLCAPLKFSWDPNATVHFVIPVKNQARWVQQFITDMERLYRETRDQNFNIIIVDYSSTDINVERALKVSSLPRYQYLRLKGHFERSAGIQAGVNHIKDDHSIVFMCDLHIHFPSFIIDAVRKHCVKGKMAFAPIVMRLDCGATRSEPRGFWEVNGLGLLGIYKSDLNAAGGMNTKEYRDRWGGEDWELLDRLLTSGLEVERLYLRNFLHHYHSKRGMWNRRVKKPT